MQVSAYQYYQLEIPGGTHLGPGEIPTDVSPFPNQCWIDPMVLMIARCPLAINQETEGEKNVHYLQALEYTRHARGHTEGLMTERVNMGLGFFFYWGCKI